MKLKKLCFLGLLCSSAGFASMNIGKAAIYKDNSKTDLMFKLNRATTQTPVGESSVTRLYTDASDKKVVEENFKYKDGKLSYYTFESYQNGEKGHAEVKEGKIYLTFAKAGEEAKTDSEDYKDNTIMSDQIVPYLQNHWNELVSGNTVKVRYVSIARRETVGFEFFKVEDTKLNGQDAIKIKMKPSSFIIAAIVNPLFFTFAKDESKKLLTLEGRTAPQIQDKGKWKDLDAYTVYE